MDRWNSHKIEIVNNYRQYLMDNRPEYKDIGNKSLVEVVWENAVKKSRDGKVRNPYSPYVELNWVNGQSRFDQWHMGHIPGKEYWRMVDKLIEGEYSEEQFLKEYNNPNNYQPEDPKSNMSHKNEKK